jgi:PAS domain S-box-containing protein
MERTGVALVACDAGGRLTLLSPPLQEMFGIGFAPIEEAVVPTVFRMYHEDGVTPLRDCETPLARARAGEYVDGVVVTARDREGRLRHLLCNAAPLERGGRRLGAIALVQDVTTEREAAQVTERVRRRLVQVVDHEFRTPLTALLGHLEVVREHHDDEVSPDLRRSLAAIERAGWRLRDLVCRVVGLLERDDERQRTGRSPDGAPLLSVDRPTG